MSMNYRIAICSYKRSDIIQEKTLNFLKENNIPSNLIDIFVANKEEYEIYKENIPSNIYNKLIIAKLGYHNVKNYIMNYYPENTYVWHLDDDIQDIQYLKNNKLTSITNSQLNLENIIKYNFKLLKKHNCQLLGLYPVANHFFMSNTLSKGLYFCIGNCFWTINTHNPQLKLELPDKTDYELNIKSYLKYGNILRLDNMVAITNYDDIEGGTSTYRTLKLQEKVGKTLIKKYPHLCEKNNRKRENFEIKFKKQKGNIKVNL